MKSLERNMSRNLARLKYSTPAVLVALACIAAPSFAMADAHGSGLNAGASAAAQAAKTGPAAQVAPMAPSVQSLSANVVQGASSQAVAKLAPPVQSLQPIAFQSAASQAALKSVPSLQSFSVSVVQGSSQAAALPETKVLNTAQAGSALPAQSATRAQLAAQGNSDDRVRSHASGAEPNAARVA